MCVGWGGGGWGGCMRLCGSRGVAQEMEEECKKSVERMDAELKTKELEWEQLRMNMIAEHKSGPACPSPFPFPTPLPYL